MPTYGKPLAGVCASTALFLCGLAGFPIAPDTIPPATGALKVISGDPGSSSITLRPGSSLRLSGDGFADDAAVSITLYSEPTALGTTTADSAGAIDETVVLPTDVTGTHTVTALGLAPDGSAHSLQASVTLAATVPGASPVGDLPATGLRAMAFAGAGVGLLVAGFALIRTAVYRRRFLPVS